MAKAKQSKSDDKPAKKSGGSGKPAAKKSGGGSSSHAPSIDTNLAASAAASMILSRATGGSPSPATTGGTAQPAKKETSTFKQLKQNLTKPSSPGGLLSNTGTQKKAGNLPFGGGQQKGHNQTFGADVNRAGVPRRTGGG